MTTGSFEENADTLLTHMSLHEDLCLLNDHIHKYTTWLADHDRWLEWKALLTADTVFEYVTPKHSHNFRGTKEVSQTWGALVKCCQNNRHDLSNRNFEVAPDKKTAMRNTNGLFAQVFEPAKPNEHYMHGDNYQWEFVKMFDGWKTRRTPLEVICEHCRDMMDEVVADVTEAQNVR